MCGGIGIGVVQEILDSEEDLLDGDGGFPGFVLVENAEADGARGVDIGVEERGREFACIESSAAVVVALPAGLTLGGFRRVL